MQLFNLSIFYQDINIGCFFFQFNFEKQKFVLTHRNINLNIYIQPKNPSIININ